MRRSDVFVIAAWAATFFGLIEGITLCISRAYPAILAAHKFSNHVLWVAPAVDLPLFLLAAAAIVLLIRPARRWLGASSLLTIYGVFVFLGFFTVTTAPKIIHLLSAAILSLGLAVVFCHKLRGSEHRLTIYLRGRLVWIVILVITPAVGVSIYDKARERWVLRHLPRAPAGAMNVLVIVMDTVRHDSFTRGTDNSLMPRLDRIATKGVRFENAWATSSWSLASHASILTGRYPHEHGADWPTFRLDKRYPALDEFFAGRGYLTGAFSGNSAWVTPEYLGQKFLRFDVYTLEDLLRRTVHGRIIGRLLWEVGYHPAGRGKKAPQLNAQLLKFLDDYPARPFFAYLCYMDVNQAFHDRWFNHYIWKQAPVQEIIEGYQQGLRLLDTQIGDLLDELQRRRILENTLVIITSDHGQSFGAATTTDHDPHGHGTSLYPEQLKVPLFLFFSGKLPTAREITSAVSLRQIPVTITRLLGLGDSPFGGEALPLLDRPQDDHDSPVLATLNYDDRKIQSVIWDRWQYISDAGNSQRREELYDLATDPLAKQNLVTGHLILKPIRDQLQQLLGARSQTSHIVSTDPKRRAEAR